MLKYVITESPKYENSFNQLSAHDKISRHGKLPLTVHMTRYLVMAGSQHVALDRCGMLILWE